MFELEKPLQKSNFRRKLGKEFYILKRKFDNLISKENFSKQYSENFEINHSVFKHNSMILRPLKDVEMYLQHNKKKILNWQLQKLTTLLFIRTKFFLFGIW
jgi:vancomycin resistance protein VanW